jgi:hypothetical protein
VAKVATSNPDRTISLKSLQFVVENKHKVEGFSARSTRLLKPIQMPMPLKVCTDVHRLNNGTGSSVTDLRRCPAKSCSPSVSYKICRGKGFGPKRDEVTGKWRKLHNEELNDLYSLPNIMRVVKSDE